MRALRGPNEWSREPVLVATLLCGAAAADAVAHQALSLQEYCGCRVSFSGVAQVDQRVSTIAVEFEDEEVGRRCLNTAVRAAEEGAAFDLSAAAEQLKEFAEEVLLGPNTRALFDATRRRRIPVRRLDRGSLLQLGHGVRQRRLCGARTDRTSAIGETIGWEKPVAKELLRAVGVPTPEGRVVADAEDAWRAAAEVGGVVVVKPESANHGRSVFIGITRQAEIAAAYESAREAGESGAVLVERFVPGAEHRVLVIDGQVAAATRGDPLYVCGDGVRTIAQLIDEVNEDPRRGDGIESPLYPVTLDEMTLAVLSSQGHAPESVPGAGVHVLVQRNGNLSRDVTSEVHADNRALCVLAAQTIGLDIAGVDLVVEDIARPLCEQGGAVLEVNAMPGVMMHLSPGAGVAQPVDEMIIASVFPEGDDGRIPLAAVSAGAIGSGIAKDIDRRLREAGLCVGLRSREGTFAGGTRSTARDLLMHPRVEAAVFEIAGEWLEFDRCHVAVIAGDSLTAAKRVLLESVAADGVALVPANADWLDEARKRCPGIVVETQMERMAELAVEALLRRR